MAEQSFGRDGKALFPLRYIAGLFMKQTLEQLQINMMTQHIYPFSPYPTYPEVNEYRRQLADNDHNNGWFSDGEGFKSFEGIIYEADENTGIVSMGFRFNDYMQYVDIGVGAGRKAADVQRSRKVRYQQRYTNWLPRQGKTHRPAIQPEINHALTRIENYVQRHYDAKLDFEIVEMTATPVNMNL
jgi:hypothetical protein